MKPFRKSWLWCLPPAFGFGLLGGYLGAWPFASGNAESDERVADHIQLAAPPGSEAATLVFPANVNSTSRLGILERLAVASLAVSELTDDEAPIQSRKPEDVDALREAWGVAIDGAR
jgi:hypothetical protein